MSWRHLQLMKPYALITADILISQVMISFRLFLHKANLYQMMRWQSLSWEITTQQLVVNWEVCGRLWLSGHESIICLQAGEVNKNTSSTKIRMELYQVTKAILFHLPTLMHNSLFINNMFVTLQSSTCFEHQHAHFQEGKLYYHSIWYRHSL